MIREWKLGLASEDISSLFPHSVVGGKSLTRSAHMLWTKGVAWGCDQEEAGLDETSLYAAYHNRW